ncbi:FkbM family methyltransferase [Roseixanthobacter pseudopolyaromaticivorans]|uniref:FkbM family methyltransferase n=1 Tax=Xanthobacteraceae TaxID=335928 RepID=UPI0037286335
MTAFPNMGADGARAPTPCPVRARRFDAVPDRRSAMALLQHLNARAIPPRPVKRDGRPLALYGAGNLGKLARQHLDAMGQPIAFIVDADAARHLADPDWHGLSILSPEDVAPHVRRETVLAVSIANMPYTPIQAELAQQGWAACVPFYDVAEAFRDRHPLSNGWFSGPLDLAGFAAAATALERFADDASRAHYLRFAAWHMAREEWDFAGAPVVPATRFFIPELAAALRAGARFLDGGAHHGSVTARLIEQVRGQVSAVWAIEPDSANAAVLRAFVAGLDGRVRARVHVLGHVVGARRESVPFHEGLGYASQISSTGQSQRECLPIDALGLDPTYVKLHLEGGELAALEGARETLRRHRPAVAVTVYHNADGLARTPSWLAANLENYELLMRTHAWCGTGAVIYALPKEYLHK